MKKHCIWLCFLILTACIAPPKLVTPAKSWIDRAIWPDTPQDKAYTACLTALQMQSFDIDPLRTSKASGLIIVEQTFCPVQEFRAITGHYKLQMLISELSDNKAVVNVNVKASYEMAKGNRNRKALPYFINNQDDLRNKINNKLAEDLATFFTQLDILLGKAEYHRTDRVLSWK